MGHIEATGWWLQEQQLIEVSCQVTINAGTSEKGTWSPQGAKASRDSYGRKAATTREESYQKTGLLDKSCRVTDKGMSGSSAHSQSCLAGTPPATQGSHNTRSAQLLAEYTEWKRKMSWSSWSCCPSQAFSTNQAVFALQRDPTH